MRHRRFTHLFRRGHLRPGLLAAASCAARLLSAQATQPAPGAAPTIAPYRAPAIALVQPSSGGSLPRDKPVVVFRFIPGEPGDPIDVRSLAVFVDGIERTPAFRTTDSEAWGSLADVDGTGDAKWAAGPHQVRAQICSQRGACAEVTVGIVAVDGAGVPTTASAARSRGERLLDALLRATRKLLGP